MIRPAKMPPRSAPRLLPIDALRGLIMILMALDHASYFAAHKHSSEHWGGGLTTYPDALSFFTRWLTHLAPTGFFFLMGAGMVLFAHARRRMGWSEWAITRHLLVRGSFLLGLKFLVVNRIWELGPFPMSIIYLGVLFGLGGSMIFGSLLLRLKPAYLPVIACAFTMGLQFLYPAPSQWGQFDILGLAFLYTGGDMRLWSNYPILPWLGLTTLGMIFGHLLTRDDKRASWLALGTGLAFLLAFVVLRRLGGYGNIRPLQDTGWMDFLNVVKYPPSMVFILVTLGMDLVLLWLFAQVGWKAQRLLRGLAVFGQTPLLFYALHLCLYMALGRWLTPHGTSLPAMYPIWLAGLAILFPLCLAYGRFKQRQPANSPWHFF
ncbi:MAG: DUF1624 domain-containing protein [Chloroflexota bacterium]